MVARSTAAVQAFQCFMSTLSTTAYTPLESLLLFQALRANGVELSSFTRISSDIKSVPLVQNDPSYDAARLAPDALRQLYLDLLKEEAKHDLERQLTAETNGDVSPNTRKRKVPSPKLPTIREAAQHSHLIPQLLTRLYLRYREVTVATIREQEDRYDSLLQQTKGAATAQATAARGAPLKDIVGQNDNKTAVPEVPSSSGTSEVNASSNVPPPAPRVAPAPKRLSQARIDDMLNRGSPVNSNHAAHRRSSSGNSMPTLADLAGVTQQQSSHDKPTTSTALSAASAGMVPSHAAHSTHHAMQRTGSHGSPQLQQNLTPKQSASPRPLLPPPPGIGPGIAHPASPNLNMSHHPQARAQQAQAQHTGHQRQNQANYAPPHFQPNQTGDPQTQQVPTYPANSRGGVMLPPFQLTQSDSTKPHQPSTPLQQNYAQHQYLPPQQNHPYVQPQLQQYRQGHPPYNAPSTGPRPQHSTRLHQHPLSGLVAALATPPRSSRQPVWKSEKRPPPLSAPGSPKRPDVEPLSPILARATTPTHVGSTTRRQTAAHATRGTRRHTSHQPRDLRSASVESTANGSEDTHTSRRKIKPEPSTPIVRDSEEPEAEAAQATGVVTRKRRGTVQNLQPAHQAKRQRQLSSHTSKEDLDSEDPPPPRSNIVVATRNFGRISSVIMNDIVSHKHGSRFAQPVRDSHAEGYSSFIKRPQDLKSIRAAISHGSKAIVAATANSADSPIATTASAQAAKSGETTVDLERSTDLIPPKAIVNGAQLEREIMRMFANAVMFNPGEDGMVADTREMYEDVEAKLAEWRGAEREGGSAASVGEDEDESRAKRRKL